MFICAKLTRYFEYGDEHSTHVFENEVFNYGTMKKEPCSFEYIHWLANDLLSLKLQSSNWNNFSVRYADFTLHQAAIS
jgi:hypothetical protein